MKALATIGAMLCGILGLLCLMYAALAVKTIYVLPSIVLFLLAVFCVAVVEE